MILRVKFTVVGTKLHLLPGKRMNVPLKINGWFNRKGPFLGDSLLFWCVCVCVCEPLAFTLVQHVSQG